jgi:hypothetical protein
MNHNSMRGFADWRFASNMDPRPVPDKPRCKKCHAVLRSSNPGPLCCPCERGEIEIPNWILALAEADDGTKTIENLANIRLGAGGRAVTMPKVPAMPP